MKNLKLIFISILITSLFNSCTKEEQNIINFAFTFINDSSDGSLITIEYDNGEEIDGAFQKCSQLFWPLGPNESATANFSIKENSSLEIEDIGLGSIGFVRVNTGIINDGDTVSWKTGDSAVQINGNGNGSGGNGDGDGDGNGDGDGDGTAECKDWTLYNTECLSGVADGTGSSKAGVRARVCKLSETATTITVRSEIEAINGGIDNINFYRGLTIYYGDGTSRYISKEDFNSQGEVIKEFTANKSDIHPSLNWDELGNGAYALIFCETN